MIKVIQMKDDSAWDRYVASHAMSNAYHTSHWQRIITRAYGNRTYALAAVGDNRPSPSGQPAFKVKGVLPLVHLKSLFFGNRLVSMPFFDHGGIIADNPECEEKLVQAAFSLGKNLKVQRIELRHLHKITSLENRPATSVQNNETDSPEDDNLDRLCPEWSLRSHKVRLLVPLPSSSEALMKSFKSKLRSQIKRPLKAGLTAKIGGKELLENFYTVFSINMRDLGSPVHAKLLMKSVLEHFQDSAKVVLVLKGDEPVAASLMVSYKDTMINPWASSLRQYNRESPNMLLYWSMLAYAADHGYRHFDFGRSTPGEGTYRFKTQWGAQPHPMYWYTIWLDAQRFRKPAHQDKNNGKGRAMFAALWCRLPISISRIVGPMVRKHIDL